MQKFFKDLLIFQIDRQVKSLFKSFLDILEDQKNDIKSLEDTLTGCGFEINKKSEEKFNKYRRTVLNNSNNTIRELSLLINKFDFNEEIPYNNDEITEKSKNETIQS
jgi:hypothetical protein